MNTLSTLHSDFYTIKNIYSNLGINITELNVEPESREYGACNFKLGGMQIKFRVSKITPTKTGQFVTIWKRSSEGITEPFDVLDEMDFTIIAARQNDNFGQFIFPKSVLAERGIISKDGMGGKRGIRVYAPWDIATSKQAEKTKSWQVKYFLNNSSCSPADLVSLIKLEG